MMGIQNIFCNISFSVVTILLFFPYVKCFELNPSQQDRYTFATYYCVLAKDCIHGGDKVCGYDEHDAYLAQFEDLCTFYKTNCNGVGMFVVVRQVICDVKKKYLVEHGNDFEWIHINNSTGPSPRELSDKNSNKKFAY